MHGKERLTCISRRFSGAWLNSYYELNMCTICILPCYNHGALSDDDDDDDDDSFI